MMLKIKLFAIFIITAIIFLSSCEKKRTLVVTPSSQSVFNQEGSFLVTILSNTTWTIQNNNDWCSVSRIKGSNNSSIKISYDLNNTASNRTATIVFSGENVDDYIVTINQDAGIEKSYLKKKTYYNSDGKISKIDSFIYNIDNILTSVILSNNEKYVYEYNINNDPIKNSYFGSNDELIWQISYEYNSNNQMIKSIYNVNSTKGKISLLNNIPQKKVVNGSWETFEYDTEGQMIKSNFYNDNGVKLSYTIFEYKNDNISKNTTYVISDDVEYKYSEKIINYDNKNVVLLNTSLAKAFLSSKAKNNIINYEYIYYDKNGTVLNSQTYSYNYEYNEKGFPAKQINDDNSYLLFEYINTVK